MHAAPHEIAEGMGRASRRLKGVSGAAMAEVFHEFSRCPPDGQVAFARTWIKKMVHGFEETWPLFYRMLKVIDETKIYQQAFEIGNKQAVAYDSFAAYFEAEVKQPFTTWHDLEETHHYVTNYAPELLSRPFSVANGARIQANIPQAAKQTTGEVLDADGSIHPGNARQFADHTQTRRAELGGVSPRPLPPCCGGLCPIALRVAATFSLTPAICIGLRAFMR